MVLVAWERYKSQDHLSNLHNRRQHKTIGSETVSKATDTAGRGSFRHPLFGSLGASWQPHRIDGWLLREALLALEGLGKAV